MIHTFSVSTALTTSQRPLSLHLSLILASHFPFHWPVAAYLALTYQSANPVNVSSYPLGIRVVQRVASA